MKLRKLKHIYIALFMLVSSGIFAQNVGINEDGSAPHGSAMLHVKSANKGVLIPSIALGATLTDASMIATTPAEGLMIYNNDNTNQPKGYYFWNGTSWQAVDGSSTPKHYVGEIFGGGIVFYVYNDGQNGLIASLDDVGADVWDNASGLCTAHNGGGKNDWYLPNSEELDLLFQNSYAINKILNGVGNVDITSLYWSSSSENPYFAWCQGLRGKKIHLYLKTQTYKVRAIRSF